MGKYKICVYAICKNEEKFVERWVESVKEADLIVVTDTGSTDHTVEKLREKNVIVYEEKIDPWRFDEARNRAMDHVPEDVDICVSNDLDEVFDKGWREKLEDLWKPEHTRARYLFTCTYHKDGTPDKQHVMEKIHRRQGFRWIHPVHEILEYTGKDPDCYLDAFSINLNHYPDNGKSRGSYLPLLELSVKENPTDSQTTFWLGREYMFYGMFEKSINTLNNYLNIETSVWDEERSAAYRFIAYDYDQMGNKQLAKAYYYRAIGECSHVREVYLAMAHWAYKEQDWNLLFWASEKALEIQTKTGSYLMEMETFGAIFDDYASIACYNLGLFERAVSHVTTALQMEPTDERLKNNLLLMKEKVGEQQ